MARYSKEEIEDNYEFKVMKRLIKKEFPFVMDMALTDNWDNYSSLFFVDLTLSTSLLMEYLDIPNTPKSTRYLKSFRSPVPYLTMLFPSEYNEGDRIYKLGKGMQSVLKKIHESPSIPDDMRLPRPVNVSGFSITDNPTIPNNKP
jgi:hypothetical protein